MENYKRDMIVGIMFFIGVAIIGFFTIAVENLPMIEGRKGKLIVIFNRVEGLEKGHKVLASGMEVGQVSNLELLKNGKVKVTLDLIKPIKLYKDYRISVKDASALGGKYVDVELGEPEEGEIPLGYLEGERPLEGTAQPSILNDPNLRDTIKGIKEIVNYIKEGKGTIGLFIKKREIYDNINKASENIKNITEQIKNTEGTIGKLLYDKQLANKVYNIVENIKKITDNIRKGEGTLGKLLSKGEIYKELKKLVKNANKAMENIKEVTEKVKKGEGTIGKLLVKEDVYKKLKGALTDARKMIKNINKAVTKINKGKGIIGKLINDEEMGKDLKETLADIKVVVRRLKKGEGTVGKLLAKEEIYKELKRLLKSFSDSLEDTREQVPITTFTNILFKAF